MFYTCVVLALVRQCQLSSKRALPKHTKTELMNINLLHGYYYLLCVVLLIQCKN